MNPVTPLSLNDLLVSTKFQTEFGEATYHDMRRAFENEKRRNERRKAYFQTEAGKEYNRQKAKNFYQRHRDEILAKRKEQYQTKKEGK